MRNNKGIKCINIDGIEYLISQYADDTTFFFDASSESLNNTMQVLDYYAAISGLKINYIKSKAIWIGSKKYSKDVYHHTRWKLEWGSNQFSLLGINFTLNLNEIIESNFDPKMKQIKNLIKIWSFRKLTVLGRIPQITYLLISLPNPPKQTIEVLTKMFF